MTFRWTASEGGRPTRPVDFPASTGQPSAVDLLKVVFYMAAAALVAVLGVTWKDFKRMRAEEPPEKVFEVNRQIREIRFDQEKIQAARDRITGKAAPVAEASVAEDAPPPPTADVDLAAVDAASTLSDPTEAGEAEPGTEAAALAPALAPDDRAKAIAAAPVAAKIKEWVEDPQFGDLIFTLKGVDAAVVKPGGVLCVRRNSGIIARLKVSEVEAGEASATLAGTLGELKPQVEDELILDPEAAR